MYSGGGPFLAALGGLEILGPDQQTMAAALRVRSARSDRLASNVANADTPGYLARDLDFETALSQLRDRPDGAPGAAASDNPAAGEAIAEASLRFDRNDVDVNRALAKAYANSLDYVATLKLYGDSIQRLVSATLGS
ncbi:MAG: flagellar basal body rod protein FlgB [Stellaceae bacterium]